MTHKRRWTISCIQLILVHSGCISCCKWEISTTRFLYERVDVADRFTTRPPSRVIMSSLATLVAGGPKAITLMMRHQIISTARVSRNILHPNVSTNNENILKVSQKKATNKSSLNFVKLARSSFQPPKKNNFSGAEKKKRNKSWLSLSVPDTLLMVFQQTNQWMNSTSLAYGHLQGGTESKSGCWL